MKVLVACKRVIDYAVKVRVRAGGKTGVETNGVKHSMNPFDEIAVEEGLRLKERGQAEEVLAISMGPKANQETLRTALAMGVDRAILLETVGEESIWPQQVALKLAEQVKRTGVQLVILGKQAIDDDAGQVGPMLAGLLGWSQATAAYRLSKVSEGTVEVIREIDGGLETIECKLPTVITCDLRLNEPRYATLPNIMKAKQKPLEVIPVGQLEPVGLQQLLQVEEPPKRKAGVIVESVDELVQKLRSEAKII